MFLFIFWHIISELSTILKLGRFYNRWALYWKLHFKQALQMTLKQPYIFSTATEMKGISPRRALILAFPVHNGQEPAVQVSPQISPPQRCPSGHPLRPPNLLYFQSKFPLLIIIFSVLFLKCFKLPPSPPQLKYQVYKHLDVCLDHHSSDWSLKSLIQSDDQSTFDL